MGRLQEAAEALRKISEQGHAIERMAMLTGAERRMMELADAALRTALAEQDRPEIVRVGDEWPEAISDGLTIPCPRCGEIPAFDYHVEESFWREIVPKDWRLGVVCLPCLDEMAHAAGRSVGTAITSVQFIGTGVTVVMVPTHVYLYRR